jgi:hypothetical protein
MQKARNPKNPRNIKPKEETISMMLLTFTSIVRVLALTKINHCGHKNKK